MKIKLKPINLNEIALSVRRSWGQLKPIEKVVTSKKIYNRKNKERRAMSI